MKGNTNLMDYSWLVKRVEESIREYAWKLLGLDSGLIL
jgi:hypothetical protein